MRIHLIPNSHIDPVWLWDKYEGLDEVLNTFRSVCDRLDEYPTLTFAASSLQFYQWVRQYDAKLFQRIVGRVREGRWEVAGGWWIEPDTNLPTEASFIKHAEISQEFARKHFGREIRVAYLPDTFGHPATLPKILARAGFKYMVFCRPSATEKKDLPANLFHWEYEGHRILAYRLKHHYVQDYVTEPQLRVMWDDEEYKRMPANCFFFGVGDHGGGPSIAEIGFCNRFIASRPAGDVGYSTCLRFFEEAAATPDIPLYRGDLHPNSIGCYSVMGDLKRGVRGGEHGLEFATRALEMNGQTDACLEPAWKTTLFNQFHDILPGSCAAAAADQAKAEQGGVQNIWRETAYAALKSVSQSHPASAKQGEFRIFNTLPFEVTVPLAIESMLYYHPNAAFRDGEGKEILIQETLPSVRCISRRWEFVDTLPARKFKSYYFDNETLVERAAPDAIHFCPIKEGSAADKPENWKNSFGRMLQSPMRFLVMNDPTSTWGHGVESFDAVEGEFAMVSSASLSGPVTDRLYQHWAYKNSTLDVVYSTYKHLPGVYVELGVIWTEKRKVLKIEMCPPGIDSSIVRMQGAGGPIERRANGKELPMHHWVWMPVGDGGMALVQDGALACDCALGRLRVTFARSSIYSFHEVYGKMVPTDPQRFTDQGEHRMRLRLLPQAKFDAGELDRLAAAFIEPYWTIRECPQ